MNSRSFILLFFTALAAIIAAIAYDPTYSSEHFPPWLQSFSEKEKEFVLRANQLSIRLHEGHMDHDDLLETYQIHEMWTAEYNKQTKRKRNGLTSQIGSDSINTDFFTDALLRNRDISSQDLHGRDFRWANLFGYEMRHTDIRGNRTIVDSVSDKLDIDFSHANLIGINGKKIKGHRTVLRFALLIGSYLRDADLSESELRGADLRWTVLQGTNLLDAGLYGARLDGAVYEPQARTLPDIEQVAYATGLDKLVYEKSPRALVELRAGLDNAGFHSQAREVTHSIWRSKRVNLAGGSLWSRMESLLYYIFLELTSKYGMDPYRPLVILILLIPIFAIPYIWAISRTQRAGIWANRSDSAVNEKVLHQWIRIRYRRSRPRRAECVRVVRIALYFSLVSAFRIGFNQFDVGSWLTRLQSRPYDLRATGWVRSVAGWQALVSVFLLALSVFCFVGRPFG